jgi:predicted anti-sigma-YlaC factor YlaD
MGPVIDMSCEQWRGLIAMRSLGGLSSDEATALDAHLEGCADCESLADEMSSTVAMLAYVDPASIEPTAFVAPELAERVLGDLHRAGVLQRRRRRVTTSAVSFVGAIAAALILFALVSGTSPSTNQRTLALGPTGADSLNPNASVTAKAVLVDQSWGTSVDFSEHGLPGGGVYTVSMKTATGTWWTAGTYRSISGQTVSATMACAVEMDDITALRVVNATGVTVLTSMENSATY